MLEPPRTPHHLPVVPPARAEALWRDYPAPLREALEASAGCQLCPLAANRTRVVPGVGDPSAIVAFVGEAPSADEDRLGEPFVGAAGTLLDKMIAAMQAELGHPFSRTRGAFILNTVQCRPPGNRKPERAESAACNPYLWATLRALPRVRVLVALGSTSLRVLSGDPLAKIIKQRGLWFERCVIGQESRVLRVMPTFHPAYLLRSPWEKSKAWADLREVVKEIRGVQ